MAEKTSLEQQLVAFKGYTADPEGVAAAAKASAGESLVEGLKDIGAAWGRRQDKIDAQNKGYEDNYENTRKKIDENLGSLDIDYFDKAADHVEEMKETGYNLCSSGKEGNRCRQREMIKLNEFINHTGEVKEVIGGYNELSKKMENGEISESNYQTNKQKAMLGSIDGNKSKLGGKNDAEILKHKAEIDRLKSAKGMTRGGINRTEEIASIQEKIDKLQKNNPKEYGWNITYIDEHTKEEISERVTLKDFKDLIPKRDDNVTNKFMNTKSTILDNVSGYKTGAKGSSAFDERGAEKSAEGAINEKNIASYWHDDFGFGKPLKERVREHPIITNLNYADLGIEIPEMDKDGVIDPEEWAKLGTEDIDKITSALSDPTHPNFNEDLSIELAKSDYVLNLKKESENELYNGAGAGEYWNADNLEYPEGTPHVNIVAKQKAIKEDLTTPRPGEDKQDFIDRGGILGALANKGITWNKETDSWNKPEFETIDVLEKYKASKK